LKEVKQATSISDNSVLYGEMSKVKMMGVVVGSILGIILMVSGSIYLYHF